MRAKDVMTKRLVSVLADVDVRDAAETMVRNGISAVIVTDQNGNLAGILSEGDLLHRGELRTQSRRSWWLQLFTTERQIAADYTKSHARKVRDVMTTDVVTVSPETSLGDIARLFEKHHIKRVPVIEDGHLAGIVTRANLVQALANTKDLISSNETDAMLEREIDRRITAHSWGRRIFSVHVSKGNVDISGIVYDDKERDAIRVAAENTPGVRSVTNNLRVMPTPIED
ncbi:CBS domain-containing protein [Bradyrhizobium sp. SYSU BS000235]|uniref:CBS domain-containing protein n=1 Tax=Bradyrhizobium sp. SYSU BS000235 TaxID=3411332 RepID=UPI003C74F552